MGVVYLARHAMLGRAVAIKVLRQARPAHDVVARFFNEARAATAVRHPGVVEVYDVGFLEDRTAYIVMEYLDGESLAARIRRGRASVEATLTIVRAIARTLQAVHARGIVHRDLKPDNVFLVPDPEAPDRDRVKLLDFGIAKLAESPRGIGLTTTGTLLGTPIYMSPEQCRGDRDVDHRTDLYSLGCIAYEMLCGQPPFPGDAPGDVIARHQYFDPVPPRCARPELAPGVDRLVMRLLEKRPADRYRTAADVVRAVDGLLAPAAVDDLLPTLSTMPGATAATVAGKPPAAPPAAPRRRRLGIVAGAATAVLALLLLVFLWAKGAPDAGEPGAPDDRVSSGRAARWFALERDGSLSSLRSAADALCRHGWLDAEACFARLVVLLTPRRGGALARLIHRIASAHRALDDDLAAPLTTAVSSFTRRRRLLHPVASRPS